MSRALRRSLLIISLLAAIIAAVFVIQSLFCRAASHDEKRLAYYNNEPANTIDVLFIGASDVYAGWSAGQAYEEYGFTSYPYCISATPATMWKPMLEAALENQKPGLVVIEPYGAVYDDNDSNWGLYNPAPVYQFLDNVPFSAKKIEMVEELCPGQSMAEKLSYLFPFVKHHDTYVDFIDNYKAYSDIRQGAVSPLKGMRTLTEVYAPEGDIVPPSGTAGRKPNKAAERAVTELLEYCRENEIQVLFAHFPAVITSTAGIYELDQICNYVGKMAGEYGCKYINLQEHMEEAGINPQTDFYQPTHLNARGQHKATHFLGSFIQENYRPAGKPLDDSSRREWTEAAQMTKLYYEYTNNNLDNGISEYIWDEPSIIEKLKEKH